MHSRPAIILSLGMLLEKVDTSGFIAKLLKKAAEENSEFKFTQKLQKEAFILSEQLNLGKIKPEEFEFLLLKLLGIKGMETREFWLEWNKIITIGKLSEKIQLLQKVAEKHSSLVYLSSDTNTIHVEKIARESKELKIDLDIKKQPMILEQFPLYVSYQTGKSRQQLIKHIVNEIQAKKLNKPDRITLVLGDPKSVKDKSHQAVAQRECDDMIAWCKQNDVLVKLHSNSLEETLTEIFSPERTVINKPRFD